MGTFWYVVQAAAFTAVAMDTQPVLARVRSETRPSAAGVTCAVRWGAQRLEGRPIAQAIREEARGGSGGARATRPAPRPGRAPGRGRSGLRGLRAQQDARLRGAGHPPRDRAPARHRHHRRGGWRRSTTTSAARDPRHPRPAPAAAPGGQPRACSTGGSRQGRGRLPSRERGPPGAEAAALRALHPGRDHGAAARGAASRWRAAARSCSGAATSWASPWPCC